MTANQGCAQGRPRAGPGFVGQPSATHCVREHASARPAWRESRDWPESGKAGRPLRAAGLPSGGSAAPEEASHVIDAPLRAPGPVQRPACRRIDRSALPVGLFRHASPAWRWHDDVSGRTRGPPGRRRPAPGLSHRAGRAGAHVPGERDVRRQRRALRRRIRLLLRRGVDDAPAAACERATSISPRVGRSRVVGF